MQIAALDWIIVVILLASMLLGAWRGLVYEVLSVLGWVASFILAQLYAATVGQLLPLQGFSDALRYAAGFVSVFVISAFAAGLINFLMKKLIESTGLRPVDRSLGALFGLFRGGVIALAAATAILMTPMKDADWWKDSVGAGVLSATLRGLKPVLPQDVAKHIEV
jgi:membrane protein required for colicin V production